MNASPSMPSARPPRWRRVLLCLLAVLTTLVVFACGVAAYIGNRHVPRPSLEARQAHLDRAIHWVVRNEAALMHDPNSALWHMVDRAATLTGDPGLRAIVDRANRSFYPEGAPHSPWVRMTLPDAPYALALSDPDQLDNYQAAFLSAITCGDTERAWSTSDGWRQHNQCRPLWRNMTVGDHFCSTHQMMGLLLLRRHQRCTQLPVAPGLHDELVQDIRWMLRADPLVKDAYIQRVLTLMWAQGEEAVEPVWLQRVMDAQRADGGWMGRLQIADLPQGMQLWDVRQWLAARWPGLLNPLVGETDFHASAQGLLLMALAVQSAQRAHPPAGVSSATPGP